MPAGAPVLTTARLVLTPHATTDFDDVAALWADEAVTRFILPRPLGREEVWARLLRYAGLWSLLGFGYWVAREQAGGAFVGEIGFADFRRDCEPPLGDALEMGWVVARRAWGEGFAAEAIAAALQWRDDSWPGRPVVAIVDPRNEPSLRLARRAGFRPAGAVVYRGDRMERLER